MSTKQLDDTELRVLAFLEERAGFRREDSVWHRRRGGRIEAISIYNRPLGRTFDKNFFQVQLQVWPQQCLRGKRSLPSNAAPRLGLDIDRFLGEGPVKRSRSSADPPAMQLAVVKQIAEHLRAYALPWFDELPDLDPSLNRNDAFQRLQDGYFQTAPGRRQREASRQQIAKLTRFDGQMKLTGVFRKTMIKTFQFLELEEGFVRDGRVWQRHLFGRHQSINLQLNKYNLAARSSFTMNLCGRSLSLVEVFGVKDPTRRAVRLGHLLPQPYDKWYEYNHYERHVMEEALDQAAADLRHYGMPWLRSWWRPARWPIP